MITVCYMTVIFNQKGKHGFLCSSFPCLSISEGFYLGNVMFLLTTSKFQLIYLFLNNVLQYWVACILRHTDNIAYPQANSDTLIPPLRFWRHKCTANEVLTGSTYNKRLQSSTWHNDCRTNSKETSHSVSELRVKIWLYLQTFSVSKKQAN